MKKMALLLITLIGTMSCGSEYSSNTPGGNHPKRLPPNDIAFTMDMIGNPSDWHASHTTKLRKPTFSVTASNTFDRLNQIVTDEVVHPSVLFFPDSWNGYKYWMVITPYPGGDATYENPSIIVSNDALTWIEPVGINNPVAPFPTNQNRKEKTQGDVHLFYDTESDKLIITYLRTFNASDDDPYIHQKEVYEEICTIESSNGISWSSPEVRMTTWKKENHVDGFGSPNLVMISAEGESPLYRLYFTKVVLDPQGKAKSMLFYREASNYYGQINSSGKFSWDGVPAFGTGSNGTIPSSSMHWDFHIYRLADGTFLDSTVISDGVGGTNARLHFGVSSDGKTFTYGAPVLIKNISGVWPDNLVYTTALIPNPLNGTFTAFVSGCSTNIEWGMEIVEINRNLDSIFNDISVSSNDTIWSCSVDGSIWKMNSNGNTWVKINPTEPIPAMQKISSCSDNNYLVASGKNQSVWYSTDDGVHWSTTSITGAVDISISSNGVLWVVKSDGSIWFSNPYNFSVLTKTNASGFQSISTNSSKIVVCGTNGTIWTSTYTGNSSMTWTQSTGAAGFKNVCLTPTNVIWATGNNGTVWHSINMGSTWTQSMYVSTNAFESNDDTTICLNSTGTFYKLSIFNDISVSSDDTVWSCSPSGSIWKYNSSDQNWAKTIDIDMAKISSCSDNNYLVASGKNQSVWYSTDDGVHWSTTSITGAVDISISSNGVLWVVKSDGSIWFSNPYNFSVLTKTNASGFQSISTNSSKIVVCGTNGTIWTSTYTGNSSMTWTQSTGAAGFKNVCLTPTNVIWATGNNGTVWYSINMGSTWTRSIHVATNAFESNDYIKIYLNSIGAFYKLPNQQ